MSNTSKQSKTNEMKISKADKKQLAGLLTILFGNFTTRSKKEDAVLDKYLNLKFQDMNQLIHEELVAE